MLPDFLPEPSAYPSLLDLAAAPQQVGWLWPGWIPRGMLTLLAAAPGTGKSLVALDLARRVIAGLPFPDGGANPCAGAPVLLVDAEGPLSLLHQRARAWDIDRSRLFLMLPPGGSFCDLASSDQRKLLVHMVRELRPALLIVDSLGAALPGGESAAKSLHLLLAILPRIAAHANMALLLIHHLRKRAFVRWRAFAARPGLTSTVVADDLRGSSRIAAAARSILALSPAPPPPSLPLSASPPLPLPPPVRRLEVIKSNLAPLPPPLGLLLEPGPGGAPSLRYTGPILTPPAPPSQLELCAAWLLDRLAAAGESIRPADLVLDAAAAGFSRSTLYRARRALDDRILDLGRGPRDPTRTWRIAPTPEPPPSPWSPPHPTRKIVTQ